MQIQIDGQGITITPAMRELTLKKFERGLAHVEKIHNVHVILKVEHESLQSASVTISIPGTTINAHAESDDMYKTIDLVLNNLCTQLTKHKEKQRNHRD